MRRNTFTYRFLVYLLPLIYLYSFFMSQHFHHHESDLIHNESNKFHSHILNELQIPHSENDNHSHNLDESSKYHFHFVKLSNYTKAPASRILETSPVHKSTDIIFSEENYSPFKYITENKPRNYRQRDKCVQTAANVSPPIA